MVVGLLHRAGARSAHLHLASFGAIGLCVTLWVRAKTIDQSSAGTPNGARSSSVCGRRCCG